MVLALLIQAMLKKSLMKCCHYHHHHHHHQVQIYSVFIHSKEQRCSNIVTVMAAAPQTVKQHEL